MKKRVVFCFFLSIYLIYTHKNFLWIKIEELPYISTLASIAVNIFSNIHSQFTPTMKESFKDFTSFKTESKRKF